MTEPPTFWQTITRQLSAWGHHSPIRRALEWVGLVKPEPVRLLPRWARDLSPEYQRGLEAAIRGERSKQIPDVWQAADRAERGGK